MILNGMARAVIAAMIMTAAPAPVAAAPGMVPGGSYLDSCKEIVFDAAANLLYATCDFNDPGGIMAKGMPVRSSQGFDISGCVANSIFNDNGSLYCFTEKPWGNGHAIPEGSYRASCTRSRVVNNVLVAECDDTNDETRFAELNLNECQWGGDIANDNGRLRCQAAVASATPVVPESPAVLVKPVTIQPLVKPVLITPNTASEPAPTEDERRNKKRRRGERG